MQPSLRRKLEALAERREELERLLADPGVIGDSDRFRALSREFSQLEPVAMALDYLKIAVAELASISERRCAKLTDKYFSEGLPPFLVSEPGLNSGMMIPQYVAAALVSENKVQAHPASVDSIPTSANMEDHVSMGMHSALGAHRILRNSETVLGIEYLIAAQALDLREGFRFGEGTGRTLQLLREQVPFMEHDRVLYPDIETASALVRGGAVAAAIEDLITEESEG